MMSASMLRMLGIEPVRSRPFRIANGEMVEYQTAMASFSAGGSEREASVVFGPKDQYLLRATTLEELLLTVDPIGLRLVPAEGLLLL